MDGKGGIVTERTEVDIQNLETIPGPKFNRKL